MGLTPSFPVFRTRRTRIRTVGRPSVRQPCCRHATTSNIPTYTTSRKIVFPYRRKYDLQEAA